MIRREQSWNEKLGTVGTSTMRTENPNEMARMTGLEPATSGVTGRVIAVSGQRLFQNLRPKQAQQTQGLSKGSWNR